MKIFLLVVICFYSATSHAFEVYSERRATTQVMWNNFWNSLKTGRFVATQDLSVQVFHAVTKQPIVGAKVLVGQAVGSPFGNNFLATDSNGFVAFNDESLRRGQPLSVTASAVGFGTVS